jgi:hypothetical protein
VDAPIPSRAGRWQRELDYYARMAENDCRPSVRDVAEAVGSSNQTVSDDLAELARLGLLADRDLPEDRKQRGRRAARSYVITELGLAQARGEFLTPRPVAASPPRDQPAVSGCDVDLEFDTAGVRPDAFTIPPGHIVFCAEGDSMRDADVEDGDLVLIRLTQEALNGQIALVEVVDGLTEDAALTLKRIYWEGDQVCLRPANPDHQPLYYPKTDIRVRGVAVERINRRRLR